MVAFKKSLYVFGGAADGILDNEVHCFDVESRLWSVTEPAEGSEVPCGRVFHSAAIWNRGLFMFGGTIDSLSKRSGDLYRFSLHAFPKCTLIEDISNLLKREIFCDVQFCLGEEQAIVNVHAVIVASRSPFLRRKILEVYNATYANQTAPEAPSFLCEEPLTVELREVSAEAFKMAMYSMYTDRIHPDLENNSREGMTVAQMLLMVDVYKLSLLLETRRLELLSMQYIEASINLENVLLVLDNTSELRLNSLKEYCMRFIVRDSNYRKVIMSTSFETLDRSLMVQIIRRQQFRSRPTSPEPHGDEIAVPSSLQDDLQRFLISEEGKPFTDIALLVGKEVVLAHKPILAARCKYFEALFRSFMPENHKVDITIGRNVPTLQAFVSLLRYIYYGEVNMPTEDCLYIFSAPDFFGFSNSRLHMLCKASLEREVSQANVLKMLEASNAIDMTAMKDNCLALIAATFPSIVQQPYFRELRRELLLDIADVIASKMST